MSFRAVVVNKVTKRYGGMAAVAELSLAVEPGERVVLVGHNGAGKTTLFNIVLGLTRPTAGTVTVFGEPPRGPTRPARQRPSCQRTCRSTAR